MSRTFTESDITVHEQRFIEWSVKNENSTPCRNSIRINKISSRENIYVMVALLANFGENWRILCSGSRLGKYLRAIPVNDSISTLNGFFGFSQSIT